MKYSIGTTYEGKKFSYLKELIPHIQHIEISPDSIAAKKNGKVSISPEVLQQLSWLEDKTGIAILIHGVGLSIGSYDSFSSDYIKLLDELFIKLRRIAWHSEHLAYTMVNGENLGTMLTLPRTDEVIDMICKRVGIIQKKYKVPFLLENVISMLPDAGSKYSEAAFLNKITASTGCGLILDVYNLECDEANFGFNSTEFLDELNIDNVFEMHLAGGNIDREFNFKMDVHSQLVSSSTINLANNVINRNPCRLKAITFEILDEFIENHGTSAIIEQLIQLNVIFNLNETGTITNKYFQHN